MKVEEVSLCNRGAEITRGNYFDFVVVVVVVVAVAAAAAAAAS